MRPHASLVLLSLGLAGAQEDLNRIPKCARGCITKSIAGDGIRGCKIADLACVCKNAALQGETACCLADACSKEDAAKAVAISRQLCLAVDIDVPEERATCTRSALPSGPSGAHTAPASSLTAAPAEEKKTSDGSSARGFGAVGCVLGASLVALAGLQA